MADTLLLAGFEQWGPYTTNPGEKIVTALDNTTIEGMEVCGMVLPVVFSTFRKELQAALIEHTPRIAYGIGMDYRDVPHLHVEQQARQWMQYGQFRDNEGEMANYVDLDWNPDVLQVPRFEIVQKVIQNAGLPIQTSTDAGQHICETVLRDLIFHSTMEDRTPGFVHVPHTPDQLADSANVESHEHSMHVNEQIEIVRQYFSALIPQLQIQ